MSDKKSEVVYRDEVDGRKIVIKKNTLGSEEFREEYFCAYVSLEEGEPAYRVAVSDKENVPVRVPGGFTYSGWGYPSVGMENRFYIGWDYAHAFNDDEELEDVLEDAREAARQLNKVTLEKAAREKFDREPNWYREGLEELIK